MVQFRAVTSRTHDDGFHEIQLSGKQLVFLFMAASVVAGVIFCMMNMLTVMTTGRM